jgi:septal ring-binding cell division protein DamX
MADVTAKPPPLLDPPQWAERRQLISHLLHNADGLVYLRAPTGAGKTRFLATLLEHLSEEFQVAILDHRAPAKALEGLAGAAAALAPVRSGRAGPQVTALEKPALLLLDNADGLSSDALRGLDKIAENRGRAVLLGRGGPAALAGSRAIRWVDLPPLTEDQTCAFAASLDAGLVNRLGPDRMRTLYLETAGLPGNILRRISASGAGTQAQAGVAGRPLMWLGAGVLVVLAAGVIWQQDRINAWFAEDATESMPPLAPSPAVEQPAPSEKLAAPPPPLEAPSPVDAPAPAPVLGARQKQPSLLEPVPFPRKPPQIDLPTADILREIVREPWHADAPLLDAGEPPVQDPARDALSSGPAVSLNSEPPRDVAAPAFNLLTEPPNDLALTAERQRPASILADPANSKAAVAQASERVILAPPPKSLPAGSVVSSEAATNLPGNAWLRELPPASYTLQLVGARDLGALRGFVKRHALQGQLAVFERTLEGRPWFALLLGSYPDRQAALAARATLPGRLAKEAWPRRLQDIHNLMKNQG